MDKPAYNTIIPFYNRLSFRLLVALVSVALISVTGLAITAFQDERKVLREQLLRQLTSIVELKEEQIVVWLKERQADARMLSVNKLNQDHVTAVISPETPPEQQNILRGFLDDSLISLQQSRHGYIEVTMVGIDGMVISATDPALIGTQTAHDIAFQNTLDAANGEYIQDIHFDPKTNIVGMAFGHTMYGINLQTGAERSDIVAVVITIVDMEETIYPLIGAWPGLGETGETLLVRADGNNTLFLNNLRFDDDAALSLRVPISSTNAIPAYRASTGNEGVIETPDYRGVSVVAAYRHIEKIGWGLVAKQNVDELLYPVQELTYRTIYLTIIFLLITGFVALILSRTLTDPLRQLAEAAHKVAAGNMSAPIDLERQDEIGKLADAFRAMVNSLQQRQLQREAASTILGHLNATPDVTEAFSNILDTIRHVTGCESISLLVSEPEGNQFKIVAINHPRAAHAKGMLIKMTETAVSQDTMAGHVHLTSNLADETSFPIEKRLYGGGYRSRVTVPLSVNNSIVGALNLGWLIESGYNMSQIAWLEQVAHTIALALERSRLFNEMNQQVEERTRELADANKKLQHLDKLKSKFVSDVSHELRTPVTNLKLYITMLERTKEKEKRHKYLSVLEYQASRLEQLISDILDMSRLEMEHQKPQFGSVDINGLLERIVVIQSLHAKELGLQLQFEPDVNLPPVFGERNQLMQLFTNLVANAINYTPFGEICVRSYQNSDTEDYVCVEVSDSGMGIDAEDLPNIFERFYRGKHSVEQNIPGTGLGLGIAHEIIEAHGGIILVESQVGKGSTFRVKFPVSEETISG